MNKISNIIIAILVFFAFTCNVNAAPDEGDILQVTPFEASSGILENEWEEDLRFFVQMNNTNAYTALQFDIFLPAGMTLISDEPMELMSDRFPGITKKGNFIPNHNYDCTDKGNGHYLITIYNEDFEMIKGHNGDLLCFYYLTSSDMAPGIYPITISGTVLAIDSHHDVKPATSVSFVTITNSEGEKAVNSLLDLGDNLIPSFVESKLPEANVIINGTCAKLVLTDGADFNAPNEFTATSATYTREMGNQWGTICLPYEVESNDDVAYYLPDVIEDGVLKLTKQETLAANTPAIVAKLNGGGITASAENVAVVTNATSPVCRTVTMHGSYANNTRVEGANAYYIKSNKFWQCNGYFFVDAFRAYFTVNGSAPAKSLSIFSDDAVTALSALTDDGSVKVEGYYDANGKRQDGLRKGMNIMKMSNGKSQKVLIQ